MRAVHVIHWKAAEAGPLIEACGSADCRVDYVERNAIAICRAIRTGQPSW